MPSYFQPDLSGIDSDYYKDTELRVVFRNTQVIEFDMPVFYNANLEIFEVGSPPVQLIENTDWTVQPSDIDFDSISRIKAIDDTFSHTLLKSVTITKPFISQYEIQLKFNQLYPNTIDYAPVDPNNQVELTPTLISNMTEQLAYLQQIVLGKVSSYTEESGTIKILEEDNDKLNPDNFISGELHDVNTVNNIDYIRPIYGAFFEDSVTIRNHLSGVPYVKDTDYDIIEADLLKTAKTSNTSGVYLTIRFKKPIVGTVEVDYHAYGNSTDIASMKGLYSRLETIEEFLSGGTFITPSNLRINPSIQRLNDKLQSLESNMRLLLQNGLPTYGDVSTGTAVLKKVSAIDSDLHWWSIATLYKVDGSDDFVKKDTFKFRLTSIHSDLMFECSVAVDVDNINLTQVKCLNANIPVDTLQSTCPMLRLIYSNMGATYEGVVLQIGLKLQSLQETFDIEDMSGRESCWKLVPFDVNSTPPEDTAVLLPDNTLVWATGDPEKRFFIPFNVPIDISSDIDVSITTTIFGNNINNEELTSSIYGEFFDKIEYSRVESVEFDFDINGTAVILSASSVRKTNGSKTSLYRSEFYENDTKYAFVVTIDFDNNKLYVAITQEHSTTATDTFKVKKCKVLLS
jgi:hypothetical protein